MTIEDTIEQCKAGNHHYAIKRGRIMPSYTCLMCEEKIPDVGNFVQAVKGRIGDKPEWLYINTQYFERRKE
jgi:hypothetical protein